MEEVSFEWSDGPCANAAFSRIYVYDVSGQKIEYRTESIRFHKNGKWSYSELRVFVPTGSIVWQVDQDTHSRRTTLVWQATSDGRVPIITVRGKWADMRDWPPMPNVVFPDVESWHEFLKKMVKKDVVEQWTRNASIKSI